MAERQQHGGEDEVRRLTRRHWVGSLGALGTVCVPAALAACGAPEAGAPGGKRRESAYTVRVQVWGDVQDQGVYDNIAADFNAAHSDVRMENDHQPKAAPGVPSYYEKFVSSLAANTAADVAYFQGWMWQEYALKEFATLCVAHTVPGAIRPRTCPPWPNV